MAGGASRPLAVKFEWKDESRMAKDKTPAPKIKRKLVLLMVFAGLLMLLLILRLTQVMLVQGPELQKKAETQWTRRQNLSAQRGRIIDRNGLVLAQSGTAYRVLANPPSIAADDRVRVATEVSDILGLDYDYVLERVSDPTRLQVQLKRQVESSVIDQLEALQLGNGITYTTDMKRYYPFGQLFTQLVGFTGIETEGQTGLEAEYNAYLAGTNGLLVTEVDRKNQPLSYGVPEYIAPVEGFDLTITGDSVTQSYLEKYLKQCYEINRPISASGIIMDPKTGEILAISTYPSFDLNDPPRDMVTELMSMSRARIVTDTYEAGTMFDMITTAAAVDSGATAAGNSFNCDGSRTFRLEKIRCWNTNGHGDQTLAEALGNSCNVAMMDIAAATGVDKLYDYIYSFGFNESTECGIPSEDTGEVIHRKYIRSSDLAYLSFGQTITTTAIQMANAFCAIVNGGVLMQPYVVDSIVDTDGKEVVKNEPTILRRVISSESSATMRNLLQSVAENGNGSNAQVVNYTVAGITGVSRKFEEDGVTPSRTRVVATFCGCIPASDPQLVCMVMIDEPQVPVMEASSLAGYWVQKIFGDLVQYYGILPDTTSKTRTVPNVVGMTGKDAVYELTQAGYPAYVVPGEETALVISQFPAAETVVASGTSVILYTSMTTFNDEGIYKAQAVVPKLIGKRRQDAFDTLAKLGLFLSFDKAQCTGQIDTQSEPEGALVDPGTTIYVTFPTPAPTEDAGTSPTPEPLE
ncbi:MAG: PASTA domain-containing protein [Eubacteriales bacterium]|nr:PASTA domain-containing protein [Eubacteriales bacterium]